MFFEPDLPPLPPAERQHSLNRLLAAVNSAPSLVDFRAHVPPPDRQLALFAALERTVIHGFPAVAPPQPSDPADLLLCDLLDALDADPQVAHGGSAYGCDRHLATLQAFGLWQKRQPLARPTAHELFTTRFAALTTSQPNNLPAVCPNSSPLPQDQAPNGEQFMVLATARCLPAAAAASWQVTVLSNVASSTTPPTTSEILADPPGLIHHQTNSPGEQSTPASSAPELIPIRSVRRGRPPSLDELAKGRLLGLIAYGLSFRQAAAQLGIHHATILNLLKRDEQFAQQVSEARLDALSQPLITVVRASRTSWRAAAWLARFLQDRQSQPPEATPEERALATTCQREPGLQ